VKLTVEREAIVAAVAALRPIVLTNTQIPILTCVKIEASGAQMTIEASDLDHCAVATVPADAPHMGDVAVDAQRLYGLLSTLPAGAHVAMETTGDVLAVACGRSRYRLPALPATDFPKQLAPGDGASVSLDNDTAKHLFRRVAYALETDTKTRPWLCGCSLHTSGDDLMTVTTDGVCLAWSKTDIKAKGAPGIIVPPRAMSQIVKMGEHVTLTWDRRVIRATSGALAYASKLLDGTYPDYPRVVPPAKGAYLAFDRADLLAAFERLGSVDAKGPAIMTWEAGAGSVKITREGLGHGSEEVECEPMAAAGLLPFTIEAATSTLSAFTGDAIRIRVPDDEGAALFTDPKDDEFTAVMMPAWLWMRKPKAA
jgi:DNA polymerase-3 subunit beta